jgi:glycosyltransferase involved in cell wall biosynthesis
MQKIAYLCNPYPAISHTFVFREIASLRAEGMDVFTATVDYPTELSKMTAAEQAEGQQTLVLKNSKVLQILLQALRLLSASPAGFLRMVRRACSFGFIGPKNPLKAAGYLAEAVILLSWLRKNEICHIHEHFANPTALVAMLCREYGGISYSLSIHGPDIFYQVDSAMLAEKVAGAAFVRCISHYCRSQIMRITPHEKWRNAHIVRCGVDPEVYRPSEDPQNSLPRFLCVGRLCPAKGQHLLLAACALLAGKGLAFTLVFIGDGPDRQSLRALCTELDLDPVVTFRGALGQEEVRQEYRAADIFVLPSFAEGVPVVLMEAMAMAKPVVSTRITGIPELIDDGVDGLLAVPGDVDDLAVKLALLRGDAAFGQRLGQAARQKIIKMYSQTKNNKELAVLLRRYGK